VDLRNGDEGPPTPEDANVDLDNCRLVFHTFKLDRDSGQTEETDDEASSECVQTAVCWTLPSYELDGIWESLIYDTKVIKWLSCLSAQGNYNWLSIIGQIVFAQLCSNHHEIVRIECQS